MTFEEKLYSILTSSAELGNHLATRASGVKAIGPSNYVPVGDDFPQLTYNFIEVGSEEKLPAKRGVLHLMYWMPKTQTSAYKKGDTVAELLDGLLNRKRDSFEDVDYNNNRGLHVDTIVKDGEDQGFDEQYSKFYKEISYRVVMSDEAHNYLANYNNDTTWI